MYNKLFTKILDSSVWLEDMPTRIVWVTMIAAMDEIGLCRFAAVENVALRARVTVKQAEAAIAKLEGPDLKAPNQEFEGRRLERFPDGWIIINAKKYRDMVTRAVIQDQTRERVRRFRQQKATGNASVTLGNGGNEKKRNVTPSEALAETDQIKATDQPPSARALRSLTVSRDFLTFWTLYPKKKGKGQAEKAWVKQQPPLESIRTALEWQKNQPDWVKDDGQFIPHPASYLNARGWEDEPFNPVPTKSRFYQEITPAELADLHARGIKT
jgi:hypothetical protein